MSKSPIEFLNHIIDEILFVQKNTEGLTETSFINNEILQHAFIRSVEIIGEAVKNIPKDFKEKHPQIDWKKIAGARDKMIHDYFDIDLQIVWDIVVDKLPELRHSIETIIINQKE